MSNTQMSPDKEMGTTIIITVGSKILIMKPHREGLLTAVILPLSSSDA